VGRNASDAASYAHELLALYGLHKQLIEYSARGQLVHVEWPIPNYRPSPPFILGAPSASAEKKAHDGIVAFLHVLWPSTSPNTQHKQQGESSFPAGETDIWGIGIT
jgi:hypothetical protein